MSKRARELADKAGYYIDPDFDIEFEVFAELIVRECIDICRYHPSIIVSNNWSGHDVAQDIVQRFEEHFGVTK